MRNKVNSEAAGSVLSNLRRIIHAIHAQSSAIESALGLTGPQLWALREIARDEAGVMLGEIARRLSVHRANAGRIVERLVAKGFVDCRTPDDDRRRVIVRATAAGRRCVSRKVAVPPQADLVTRVAQLLPRDVARIDRALSDLVKLLGAEEIEPTPLFEDTAEGSPASSTRAKRRPRRRAS
jgi:DNA-binding MarR family transcriptional regulator